MKQAWRNPSLGLSRAGPLCRGKQGDRRVATYVVTTSRYSQTERPSHVHVQPPSSMRASHKSRVSEPSMKMSLPFEACSMRTIVSEASLGGKR